MNSARELTDSPDFRFVIDYFRALDFTDPEVYANWLAQTYAFVSHSVRLSALGASRLDADEALAKRMVAHTTEEKGHHLLAKHDIEALGRSLADYPSLGITNAFYQAQYYKVLFEHPAHLLGQIVMLEAVSAELGPWLLDIVERRFGRQATSFVRVHAYEDQDHVLKALAAVKQLPPEQRQGVEANFHQACEIYHLILRSIRERAMEPMKVELATA